MDQYFNDGKINSALEYALSSLVGTYLLIFAVNEIYRTKLVKK